MADLNHLMWKMNVNKGHISQIKQPPGFSPQPENLILNHPQQLTCSVHASSGECSLEGGDLGSLLLL